MVVQHNMQAANASRMLAITSGNQSKSTEKLSSGYRINRAADDAAGLSISEKMRKQIRGLDQASTNAQDGVSAVQTAEGALTEVHSMLQRMNELAVQASNGTNSATDRKSIQDEIDQLTTEIDRVAETTKFNETYLLKGDANGAKVTRSVNAHDAGLAGTLEADGKGTTTFSLTDKLKAGDSVNIAGADYKIAAGKSVESYAKISALNVTTANVGDSITLDGKEYTLTNKVKIANITNTEAPSAAGTASANAAKVNYYQPSAGDQITTKDGTVYQYYVKGTDDQITAGTANNKNVGNGWYKKDEFTDTEYYKNTNVATQLKAIAVEGSSIKLKNAQSSNGLKEFEIVKKLDDGELSAYNVGAGGKINMQQMKALAKDTTNDTTAINDGETLTAGDAVTVNGVTTTATDADFNAEKLEDVSKKLGEVAAGSTVKIADIDGKNDFTYTIVENTANEKPDEGKLTRESIAGLLEEGQQITIKPWVSGTDTTAPSGTEWKRTVAGVDTDEEGAISITEAYNKMATEIQKASSIGADTEAKVANNNDGTFTIKQGSVTHADKLNFNLHVGADADMTNKITVDVNSMSSAYLGVKGLNVNDDTGMAATYAIDAIADAVAKVSEQRSALGAIQNRLEHTIANVDNVVENSNAAESRIRDTDMAEEMVNFSKNNILAQAGQAMLALANQATQGVLSILG